MTRSLTRPLALMAMVVGVAFGSYGIASAATSGSTATTTTTSSPNAPPEATAENPWGRQRSDETLLTGETLSKVKAAALARIGSNATIVRIETDADGHAAYEAHMLRADGTPVTVYVDTSFEVVAVVTR